MAEEQQQKLSGRALIVAQKCDAMVEAMHSAVTQSDVLVGQMGVQALIAVETARLADANEAIARHLERMAYSFHREGYVLVVKREV